MKRAAFLLPLLAVAACERRPDDVPVVVSVIADAAPRLSPARTASAADEVLTGAVAQGLVRFDANGQVEPALAERWTVLDGGRSYIFRLAQATWTNGERVSARQVAAALTRAIRDRRNPLAPHLSAIDEVVEMTPLVVEIRLSRPRPDILPLLARPELAVLSPDGRSGSGPFRIQQRRRDGVLLRPAADPMQEEGVGEEPPDPEDLVRLHGESAARAILRFQRREADMVTGGSFVDWPLVTLAETAPANRRIDPTRGLFGLAVENRDGFLASVQLREAVTMALDRTALTDEFARGWGSSEAILPDQLDSASPPARAPWQAYGLDARRAAAAARIRNWRAEHGGQAPRVTIAMPGGPGASRLAAALVDDLAAIGILARRVGPEARADLRLIDEVAPYDSARWYLRRACQPCAAPVADLIGQARRSGDLAERSRLLARADAALARDVAFIPIAQPLRWSLVALRLRAWHGNARAWHPLNHLRRDAT